MKVLGEAAGSVAGDFDGIAHGLNRDDTTKADTKGAFSTEINVLGGDGHGANTTVDDFVSFYRGSARLTEADGDSAGDADAGSGGAADDLALDPLFGVADVGKDVDQVLALEEFERQWLVVRPVNVRELIVIQNGDDVIAALEFKT